MQSWEIKAQIKKDKARLKELRKLDKQNALSLEESAEYVRLLNESADRNWKSAEKLKKVTLILLGLTVALQVVSFILLILTAIKG